MGVLENCLEDYHVGGSVSVGVGGGGAALAGPATAAGAGELTRAKQRPAKRVKEANHTLTASGFGRGTDAVSAAGHGNDAGTVASSGASVASATSVANLFHPVSPKPQGSTGNKGGKKKKSTACNNKSHTLKRLNSSGSTYSNDHDDDTPNSKMLSRIERKRCREKQRRLDTNSQFTALAEIVREIETIDLVEEARYNLSMRFSGGGLGLTPTSGDGPITADEKDEGGGKPSADADPTNKKLKSVHPVSDPLTASALALHPPSGTPPSSDVSGALPHLNPATLPAFNPSNRVDLIARTIAQLQQLRAIRRRRNTELRDSRRRECELRKEMEQLQTQMARLKAMGMGAPAQQEKVSVGSVM